MAARFRPALTLAVLTACLFATPSVAATDPVSAKVTYHKSGFKYGKLVLTIRRDGTTFTRRLRTVSYSRPRVNVRDLDADGEPEVWVDTFTGGAHCCAESRFLFWVPAVGTYRGLLHSWRDPGYSAKNIDGRDGVELVSSDARFAYAFTSFAASFFPIQFWHFDHGRIKDVTRLFPGEVDLDAKSLWSLYLTNRDVRKDPRGLLAAWIADETLLGRGDAAWKKLAQIRQRGLLGPRPDLVGWPQGTTYLKELRAFLRKLGYR